MEKLAAGPEGGPALDITASIEDNVRNVARARGLEIQDITVVILDRDRHSESIARVRAMGARVRLIPDGDVAGAIMAAMRGTGVDMLWGIGGTPEGVVAAAALKCIGGVLQGRLYPRNDEERAAAVAAGYDIDRVLTTEDLCGGDDAFFACTGVTDGVLVEGIRYTPSGATSQSMVMRARTGTVRTISSEHHWKKLMKISNVDYRA
jgi:fructose-1,6-bisphosphatase II